ncbi:hypothetical protein JCM8097_001591 [Rhodosporidiobolus ruineniae]
MSQSAGAAPDDDPYELPFQLPGLRPRPSLPSAATPTRTLTPSCSSSTARASSQPASPAPRPPKPLQRSSSSSSTFLGVFVPAPKRGSAASMLTRRSRTTPSNPPPPDAVGESSDDERPPPPARASRPLDSSHTSKHDSQLTQDDPKPARRTSTSRQGYVAAKAPPQDGPMSLKIVLKRNQHSEQPGRLATQASASPPVITLDSTPAASRSASPDLFTYPAHASTSTSAYPLLDDADDLKGQKNGKDGLNRVCHHHKSMTDRPRMTCINAPECRTVWCNVCVNKYYLSCTPTVVFEPGGVFNCPVCQDTCLCAQCKKKRKGVGRDGRRISSASAATADGMGDLVAVSPVEAAEVGPDGLTDKQRRKKEKKERKRERRERKRERKGKARAQREQEEMLAGLDRLQAAQMGMMGMDGDLADEDGVSSDEDEASVQRMLVDEEGAAAVPPAPLPPPTKQRRRRSSLNTAWDRQNGLVPASTPVYYPAPPPPPLHPAAPLASASRKSRPAANRPRASDPYSIPDTSFLYGHSIASTLPPNLSTSVAGARPKRNKRPSTAFDDYAVEFANSSPVFNERVGDRQRAVARQARRGSAPQPQPYPSRDEILLATQQQHSKRQRVHRWRSGISSASSCDELSDSGISVGPDEDELAAAEERERSARAEEPLPVLAGLERNLGLEPMRDGEDGEEDISFGDMFGVGVVVAPPPELLEKLKAGMEIAEVAEFEGGGEGAKKPKVKWIEGPERRKRRAAAAAAAAKVKAESPPVEVEEDKGKDTDEGVPTAPISPVLARRGSIAASASSVSQSRASSLAPPTTHAATVSSSATSKHPTAEPEDAPPPYESHFPPGTDRSRLASPNAALFPFPSSASATQAGVPASALIPAPVHLGAVPPRSASPGEPPAAVVKPEPVEHRSATDTKLAFALLDAVRAAVDGAPRSSPTKEPDYGAAMAAALAHAPSPSSTSASLAAAVAPTSSSSSLSSSAPPLPSLPSLEAQRLEAERRALLLAERAASVGNPTKAFKPLAKSRAETQFFVAPVDMDLDDDDAIDGDGDEDGSAVALSLSSGAAGRRSMSGAASERQLSEAPPGLPLSASAGAGGFDFDSFAAESPLLVEDLWTPTSVAETSLTSISVSTAPSSGGGGGGVELAQEYPCFAAAVAGGGGGGGVGLAFEKEMEVELGSVMGWLEETEESRVMDGVETF